MSPISSKKESREKKLALFAEFKNKLLSIIQKIAVMFIACLMLLGILPIGLMPDSDSAKYSGEFVRLSPSGEYYSYCGADNSGTALIGRGGSAYLKFSLERFKDVSPEEIKSVRLRLVFLSGSGAASNQVSAGLVNNSLDAERLGALHVKTPAEISLGTLYPKTDGTSGSLSEIDVTCHAARLLAEGKTELSVRLSGAGRVRAVLAAADYRDPAYRPCLKVVTGEAEDTDPTSLEKAYLTDAAYVSENLRDVTGTELSANGAPLLTGGGREAYLRFDINPGAILGSVYSATLSVNKLGGGTADKTVIYCINNNQWSSGGISYSNRPRGDENTASSFLARAEKESGRISFDVTRAVCEAIHYGITTLTFRIVTENGGELSISGSDNPKTAPALYLKASDDKNVVCAANAAINALGSNRAAFVTMNLASSYTAEDGTSARIRWTEYNENGEKITGLHLTEDGGINRPKWFEGNARAFVSAAIRSGSYLTEREFVINIPAESAPDYSKQKFSNYIDIGTTQSESEQKLEFVNTSGAKRRWVDGRMITYRVPEKDGVILLNLSCISGTGNYITLKLREDENAQSMDFMLSPVDGKPILLKAPTDTARREGRFIYATYALPRSFTDGKSYVSLRLTCAAGELDSARPRGIYAVYMTQSSYFEPHLFTEQGEKLVGEPLFGENAILNFIENLRSLSIPLDFGTQAGESEYYGPARTAPDQAVSIDPDSGNLVYAGSDANIVFSPNEDNGTAAIYQRLEYYDRYCFGCPIVADNGTILIDYGDYKLIWNKYGTDAAEIPTDKLELSGEYKDITGGGYYSFAGDGDLADDSVIPDGAELLDGKALAVSPQSAVVLLKIASHLQNSDWRVNMINDKNVSFFSFGDGEKLQSITAKAVGGTHDGVDTVTVIFGAYRSGKLVALHKKEAPVSQSMDIYTLDFSDFDIYMKKGMSFKIFITDNTENRTGLSPKFESLLQHNT